MDADVRRKLEMVEGSRQFCRAHPSTDAGYQKLVDSLDETLTTAQQLAEQERAGDVTFLAASSEKGLLREQMQKSLVRPLVRVARRAARENLALANRFRLPRSNATHKDYLTAVAGMHQEALQWKDLLASHGLNESVLTDLGQVITQFREATDRASGGRLSRIEARARLEVVTAELLAVVRVLDGLNRYRFRANPELLTAWESASNVVAAPHPVEVAEPTKAVEVTPITSKAAEPDPNAGKVA